MPIFFAGQNSRLFQVASHLSLTLRLSLLFHEVHNRIGSTVEVRIGTPLPYARLAHIADRKALLDHLRRATYDLGGLDDIGIVCPGRSRRDLIRAAGRRVARHLRRARNAAAPQA